MAERATPNDEPDKRAIGPLAGESPAPSVAPPMLAAFLDELARQIAERVVGQLRATDFPGYVDQSASPLGRRRHIAAIRSGKLPGTRVGRRYLAHQDDVGRFIKEANGTPGKAGATTPGRDIDALAAELGFRKRRG